jgi:hypothetical protein
VIPNRKDDLHTKDSVKCDYIHFCKRETLHILLMPGKKFKPREKAIKMKSGPRTGRIDPSWTEPSKLGDPTGRRRASNDSTTRPQHTVLGKKDKVVENCGL